MEGSRTSGCGRARLVLASRSPRRRSLLDEAGMRHEAIHPGVDDSELSRGDVSPEEWVGALAYLKARAGAETLSGSDDAVVIGADTVCVAAGRILAAPAGAREAGEMIRALRDGVHAVLTGVAMIDAGTGRRDVFVSVARVRMGRIPDDEVDAYVRSGAWAGKAGAYNLSERVSAGWPISFEGEASTIMGLPIGALRRRLGRFGSCEAVPA